MSRILCNPEANYSSLSTSHPALVNLRNWSHDGFGSRSRSNRPADEHQVHVVPNESFGLAGSRHANHSARRIFHLPRFLRSSLNDFRSIFFCPARDLIRSWPLVPAEPHPISVIQIGGFPPPAFLIFWRASLICALMAPR